MSDKPPRHCSCASASAASAATTLIVPGTLRPIRPHPPDSLLTRHRVLQQTGQWGEFQWHFVHANVPVIHVSSLSSPPFALSRDCSRLTAVLFRSLRALSFCWITRVRT